MRRRRRRAEAIEAEILIGHIAAQLGDLKGVLDEMKGLLLAVDTQDRTQHSVSIDFGQPTPLSIDGADPAG